MNLKAKVLCLKTTLELFHRLSNKHLKKQINENYYEAGPPTGDHITHCTVSVCPWVRSLKVKVKIWTIVIAPLT